MTDHAGPLMAHEIASIRRATEATQRLDHSSVVLPSPLSLALIDRLEYVEAALAEERQARETAQRQSTQLAEALRALDDALGALPVRDTPSMAQKYTLDDALKQAHRLLRAQPAARGQEG